MQVDILNLSTFRYRKLISNFGCDIYHHPSYILAESDRENAPAEAILVSEGVKYFLMPYLLRACPEHVCALVPENPLQDVVSPYGYSGILLSPEAQSDPLFLQNSLKLVTEAFQSRDICSAFIRLHPILNADIPKTLDNTIVYPGGMTVSINLQLSEAEQWQQIQSSRRTKINRSRRQGFSIIVVPFSQEHISIFMDIYEDTMDRLNAKRFYYFNQNYYQSLVDLSPHIFICLIYDEDQPICGGIFTEYGGIVQYHLGGTKTDFLPLSPTNLMFDEVRLWAKARGNTTFHLGGGLGSQKDSLFDFKASFSKQWHHFSTLRLITHPEKYQCLVEARAKQLNIHPEQLLNNPFFPAYRALEVS